MIATTTTTMKEREKEREYISIIDESISDDKSGRGISSSSSLSSKTTVSKK